ncbi:hypothetical protein ASPBRDRAFT_678282 [Aspergillus brasiliensis CBS 101740]|uniref:Fungal N-terminal domain-containing protein n=1 Tax=Aspergillus brasiliensis (strain CBS 101740 / IMI 381727 / IBT 21946) TaxID=767769 RepID=A0A1L9UDY7_ASPBC|nr:hypothetical protein ASPBRDRAFT_678282 [Aspergillus brasiliensis CBS 101740]
MEAVGSASAIIGIATSGIQCSIKLIIFADQIKSAWDEIADIAEAVSVNASILQQLGGLADEALFHKRESSDTNNNSNSNSNDEKNPNGGREPQNEIFNAAGFAIVMNLASKCNSIFEKLEEGLRKASKQLRENAQIKDRLRLSRAEMVKWPFVKPQMDAMRAQLRDAKGTLMLMLQVAMLRYSKKVMEGHATRTSPISYSQEDQYLLKSSIVALEKARMDIAKQRDGTSTQVGTSGVTETKTSDEYLHSMGKTTRRETSFQVEPQLPKTANDAFRGVPISSAGNNLDWRPGRDLHSHPVHTKPSETDRVSTAEQGDGSLSMSSANERLESSNTPLGLTSNAPLGVYLVTPKLEIAYGKHHVVYRVQHVKVSRPAIYAQLDRWKESSNSSVLNQLLALSADEQEALDALNFNDGHSNITDTDTLEWIHFGEYLPVDGSLERPETSTAGKEIMKPKDAEVRQGIPVDIRVHHHRISPESLNAYGLPCKWDEAFNNLIEHKVDEGTRSRRPGLLFPIRRLLKAIGPKRAPSVSVASARVEEEVNLDCIAHVQIHRSEAPAPLPEPYVYGNQDSEAQDHWDEPSLTSEEMHPAVPVQPGSTNDDEEPSQEEMEGIVNRLLDEYTAA